MMSHTLSHNDQMYAANLKEKQFTEFLPCHSFDESTHLSSPGLKSNACGEARSPKVSMGREELVDLTHDLLLAMILNQLLYWSRRVKDFDLFLEEERTLNTESEGLPQYGWFYKSAIELSEETLLRVTKVTMRKYIQTLIEKGWLSERPNPRNKWDKTTQYRINLKQLHMDLQKVGWDVPSFPKGTFASKVQKVSFEGKKTEPLKKQQISACLENEPSKLSLSTFDGATNEPSKETYSTLEGKEDEPSRLSLSTFEDKENDTSKESLSTFDDRTDDTSKVEKLNFITEIITENTNKEHTQRTGARDDFDKNFCEKNFSETRFTESDFSAEVLRIWNAYMGQEGLPPVQLTDERRRKIHGLFSLYFENDLTQWEQFCKRVANSPFLMGQGARKWRASLDWILVEENLLKVLEGNFDDEKILEHKAEQVAEDAKQKEISAVLASIEDSAWRKLCSQLDFSHSSHECVSLGDLKAIANARFLEVEDDRLVWVGSDDQRVLSRIEDLRLKLSSSVKRMFPQARSIRTRLDEKKSSLPSGRAGFCVASAISIPTTSFQHKGDLNNA